MATKADDNAGRVTGRTAVYGILGWPVDHSASPAMHNAAFAHFGIDAVYVPFPVAPEGLASGVAGLRALGVRGVNVTVPHKEAILPLLDAVEADARALGAVNTIVRDGDRLVGSNTDGPGLVRSLGEAGVDVKGRRVTVLGAGGAARASVVGLARAGAARIVVAARRPDQADAIRRALQPTICDTPIDACAMDTDLAARFAATDLLVQATSATLGDTPTAQSFTSALPLDALPAKAAVVDLVYKPLETTLLHAARARGLQGVDGLGMLLHQGALAFERWTGHPAPVDVMRRALS
jgi:shikimate dehydrogenase